MNKKNKSRRQTRIETVQVLYRFELLNEDISSIVAFEEFDFLNAEQIKTIDKISKNYPEYKKLILKFNNKKWAWTRIDPLIKAILINASNEFLTIPPRIVINEAIEITRVFYSEDPMCEKYAKFVNAILQNIYKALVLGATKCKIDESIIQENNK